MALVLLLLSLSPISFAGIGSVEKNTGTADLFRSKEKIVVKRDLGVEMNDDIRTGNGTVNIGFDDKTKVRVEKHSKLVIDDFVYDSSRPTTSKLGLKVALGTVKYASGLIAKNNRQAVNISTPTARIGVLGTSFSMTVDEIGKSLIILLPNADGSVGKIVVEADVGQVIMNQAYQATVVGNLETKPSKPVILDLSLDQINNLLIIKKPKEKEEEGNGSNGDKNILDFNELDIMLANILDALNKSLFAATELFPKNPIKAGAYEEGNTQIFEDGNSWVIYRQFDNRIAEITVGIDSQTQIELNQAGSDVILHTQENASDSLIVINQN